MQSPHFTFTIYVTGDVLKKLYGSYRPVAGQAVKMGKVKLLKHTGSDSHIGYSIYLAPNLYKVQ